MCTRPHTSSEWCRRFSLVALSSEKFWKQSGFWRFMGSGFSAIASRSNGSPSLSRQSLGALPENCVALILMYLDPQQICELACLSRALCGASTADFVWEAKLPQNYRLLIQRVFDEFPEILGKKEIYATLSRPNSFDGGAKSVWLDKNTGKICLSISSKGLAITGIDDRRYWNYLPTDESRFQSVAYLQQIWWFEIDGEVEFPFPAGTYCLFFRLQLGRVLKRLGRRVCNVEHLHGWDVKPVHFQLQTSNGQCASSQYVLDEPGRWIHYHVGDFVVENPNASTKIKFSMTQIDCTHTKGGLCVDSVLIYPSELGERLKHF